MTVALADAVQRERTRAERPATAKRGTIPARPYFLSGAELAAEIASAIASVPACRAAGMVGKGYGGTSGAVRYSAKFRKKSSDEGARTSRTLTPEGEALAAMMAERVLDRYAGTLGRARSIMWERGWSAPAENGSAADVARYLRRADLALAVAERTPLGDGEVSRGSVGRKYLADLAASLLRDSREWRDVAGSYRSAADLAADAGPMIESADAYADADHLTVAAAREVERSTGEPLPAMPVLSADVADLMADVLAVEGAMRRDAYTAVLMGAGVPLASVAVYLGVSIVTAKRASANGARWLRENYTPADLAHLLRAAADQLGHTVPADPTVPTLPAAGMAAALAIATVDPWHRGTVAKREPVPVPIP